ncbi:hypothetical protein DK419_03475 [Methylobacterium terrae]|uniref:GGDEF domain-containing protein n=1 Tax=Methylobacterium terrae TaxID=2202827 RepID=A0A2U8WH87_9HYPH|nr:GGDEF domain-containing protein [Methylobacterium terrae]AWN45493.1 hypothetical protein DK419_03475 [Methylobacterium terrae]
MNQSSLLVRATDVLLHQEGESNPEIRALSLVSLNDDDHMSFAVLFWTQIGWVWALTVTGWAWILVFVAADVALFVVRWRLRRRQARTGHGSAGTPPLRFVPVNIGLIALVSVDILVLSQAGSDRAAILAIILTVGFCGYVASLFTAFPVLAMLNIAMLTGALELGLATGPSDVTRPFALLVPGATVAFWILTRRTHRTLVGAIRNQRAHYRLSLRDPLTKLPNRACMRDTLARHLSGLGTTEGPSSVAVLCLDLDGFKQINDRFGHAAGDWVLVHVADILRRHAGLRDTACRIGGDEYVLLMPEADEARVRSVGRSIIAATAQPFDTGRAVQARIGVSIGAALARDPAHRLDDLLEEADNALYAAKRGGRGRLTMSAASAAMPLETAG